MKRKRMIGVGIVAAFCAGLALRPASRAQTSAVPAQQLGASVRFTFGGNAAQVLAEFIGNLIFLPVHVNQGQPSLFELDSTAAISSVDPQRATELGIANV